MTVRQRIESDKWEQTDRGQKVTITEGQELTVKQKTESDRQRRIVDDGDMSWVP